MSGSDYGSGRIGALILWLVRNPILALGVGFVLFVFVRFVFRLWAISAMT